MSENTLPEVTADSNALVTVRKTHEAYEKALEAEHQEVHKAIEEVKAKHAYFILTATSVMYEAMAAAAYAGFDQDTINTVMDCEFH